MDTAPDKVVPPTTRIEFLGVTLDATTMTMEIPQEKIEEVLGIINTWLYCTAATRREMESLIGKLQFMGKCIKPGRVFIARLINWMKGLSRNRKIHNPTGNPQGHCLVEEIFARIQWSFYNLAA